MNVDWSHWLGRHKHGFCFCIFSFNSCPVNIMQDQPFLRVLAAGMCYLYAWNAKSLLNRTHDHIVEYCTIIVNIFLHYDHTKKFSIPGYTFDNNINYLFLIDSAFVNFVGIICSNCYYSCANMHCNHQTGGYFHSGACHTRHSNSLFVTARPSCLLCPVFWDTR